MVASGQGLEQGPRVVKADHGGDTRQRQSCIGEQYFGKSQLKCLLIIRQGRSHSPIKIPLGGLLTKALVVFRMGLNKVLGGHPLVDSVKEAANLPSGGIPDKVARGELRAAAKARPETGGFRLGAVVKKNSVRRQRRFSRTNRAAIYFRGGGPRKKKPVISDIPGNPCSAADVKWKSAFGIVRSDHDKMDLAGISPVAAAETMLPATPGPSPATYMPLTPVSN